MPRSRRHLVALGAVLLLLAAACRQDGGDGTGQAGDIETGVGVEGQTIMVGELSPLTGAVEVIGQPLTLGHEVYWQYVNEELGGVGRDLDEADRFQVELVTRDTQYVPDLHVQQFNAIRGDVLAVGQSLGTPTTKAILPQLREEPILTGPATLSVDWLPEDYMFAAGAPYAVQFINAAQYLEDQGTTPRAGIIYQDDDYGQEGINGLEYAAEQFDFEIVARAAYKTGDQDFTAQVNAMRQAGADHVFLTAVPSAAGRIWGTAATLEYAPRWIAQSPTWVRAVFENPELVPYLQQTVWYVADAGCDWGETGEGCQGMAQMLENLEQFAPEQKPDVYFLFGYTQAVILHEILEQAVSNGDLTREGVIAALHELSDLDIGGLLNPVSYGPDCADRVPATASNLSTVDPEQPLAISTLATVDSDAVDGYPFCPE